MSWLNIPALNHDYGRVHGASDTRRGPAPSDSDKPEVPIIPLQQQRRDPELEKIKEEQQRQQQPQM